MGKKKEEDYTKNLSKQLKSKEKQWKIEVSSSLLLYKVMVFENENKKELLSYRPNDPNTPTHGNLAFAPDILIKESNGIPLVVIEVKYGRFTSHDIMLYSAKALKHKDIYPYLRYGLVVGNDNSITNKFFVHNIGFDFAIALPNNANLTELYNLIEEQIEISRKYYEIMFHRKSVRVVRSHLEFR
jgi:hypothetical protein